MRRFLLIAACFGALALAGCKEKLAPPPTWEEKTPVVRVAPVETHPFEDGYAAGFAMAERTATREATIPKGEDVVPLAREQAGAVPERTERWQRGFVDGYIDGVRKVVTGQK